MNIELLTFGTIWGVMHFKILAYLILVYTGLAVVSSVYIFLVLCDWLKQRCLTNYVQSDDYQEIERIVEKGIDLNEKNIFGKTPLMGIVRYAHNVQILERVLGQADVNLQDETGSTPLMEATRYNTNEQITERLIQEGADIHVINQEGKTALMLAATYNTNPAIIQILINAGAQINMPDENGKTPLMMAAQMNSNPQIVDILLRLGADKTLRSANGRTAYDYAHENMELYQTQQYRTLEV